MDSTLTGKGERDFEVTYEAESGSELVRSRVCEPLALWMNQLFTKGPFDNLPKDAPWTCLALQTCQIPVQRIASSSVEITQFRIRNSSN